MQSGRAFLRNTIFYFIPFLIMTIITVVSLKYTFNMLQVQNHEIVQTQLERGLEEVEEKLFISKKLAVEISLDSTLARAEMLNYEQITIRGMDRLMAYKQRMEVCDSSFVAYTPDKLVTESGTKSMSTFCETTYSMTEESIKLILDMVQSREETSQVLEMKNGSRYVLLLYYFPASINVGERWVGFMVSENVIANKLQSVLGNMDSIFILTYGDRLLSEIDQFSEDLSDDEIKQICENLSNDNRALRGYTVMVNQGQVLDITMYVALNNKSFTGALAREQTKIFVIAIMAFSLLSLFLWMYGNYRYKKAKQVQLLAVKMYPEMDQNEVRGEYEFIQKVLEKDFERIKCHDQMLDYFRKESKQQLTWLLLKSTPPEELQIDKLMENCGIEDKGSYYGVLDFMLVSKEVKADFLDNICQVLMYQVDKGTSDIVLMVVASLNSRDANHTERLALAEKILQELRCADYVCKGISCGLVYEELSEIHSSQEEALSLLSVLPKEKGQEQIKVMFFDEITQMSRRVPHITADILQQFKECLLQQRTQEATELLDSLLAPPKDMAEDLLTYICYKIIQILLDVWQKKELAPDLVNNLLSLVDVERDVFKEEVKNCVSLLVTHEETNNIDMDQVLDFVTSQALDSEISLSGIADHFGISERSVSRIMKNKMNKTYKEYISELRLNKACELLLEGTLDIQTIAKQVGYYNVTSFNRVFKLEYGMSPGEYRSKVNKEARK